MGSAIAGISEQMYKQELESESARGASERRIPRTQCIIAQEGDSKWRHLGGECLCCKVSKRERERWWKFDLFDFKSFVTFLKRALIVYHLFKSRRVNYGCLTKQRRWQRAAPHGLGLFLYRLRRFAKMVPTFYVFSLFIHTISIHWKTLVTVTYHHCSSHQDLK